MPKKKELYDLEIERSLIGSVLIDAAQLNDCARLDPVAFHDRRHQEIWRVFQDLDKAGEAIEYTIVLHALETSRNLESIDWDPYLEKLMVTPENSQSARSYFKIVEDYHLRRGILANLQVEAAKAADLTIPLPEKQSQALVKDIEEYSTWADLNQGTMSYTWDGWLVSGLLNLLVSYSGDGKSYLALRICGCFIKGMVWPDGTPFKGETGKVLWVECEAAQALNLNRAEIFKYPLDAILTPFDDPYRDANLDDYTERALIETRAGLPEVKFIVMDSLSGGSRHKENDTGIKDVCLWAAQVARRIQKPIMLIHHLGKKKEWDSGEITLERVRGSSAIVQFARIVWALSCPDVTNRETKRLEQIKNNLAKFPEAIGMTANDQGIHFGKAPCAPHVETTSERCGDLLLDLLERGPVKVVEIEAELNGAGISMITAKRNKERLGIVSTKKPDGWYWGLPARQEDQNGISRVSTEIG